VYTDAQHRATLKTRAHLLDGGAEKLGHLRFAGTARQVVDLERVTRHQPEVLHTGADKTIVDRADKTEKTEDRRKTFSAVVCSWMLACLTVQLTSGADLITRAAGTGTVA
jgi:hypothetical protein